MACSRGSLTDAEQTEARRELERLISRTYGADMIAMLGHDDERVLERARATEHAGQRALLLAWVGLVDLGVLLDEADMESRR